MTTKQQALDELATGPALALATRLYNSHGPALPARLHSTLTVQCAALNIPADLVLRHMRRLGRADALSAELNRRARAGLTMSTTL